MSALERFASILRSEDFRLAEAFLAFAGAEYPDLDSAPCLRQLDGLGDAVSLDASDPRGALQELGTFLCGLGFRGNEEEYADPRNSYLNEVLERRTGLPIALSVVWIEVGRRAGLEVAGVGMPMHFLVGVEGSDVYADPFHGGRVLSTEDAMMLFAQLTDGRLEWQDTYLAPTPPREIVRRALTNLKAGYGASGDAERLLGTIEFLLAVPGAPEAERIDLARVLRALGRYHDAIAELRTYLEVEPEDPAGAEDEIRSLMAAMN